MQMSPNATLVCGAPKRKGHKTHRKSAKHLANPLRHDRIPPSYIPPRATLELPDLYPAASATNIGLHTRTELCSKTVGTHVERRNLCYTGPPNCTTVGFLAIPPVLVLSIDPHELPNDNKSGDEDDPRRYATEQHLEAAMC
jgi:hypothetical protein